MQTAGVDNTHRRKWNKEEYLEKAREREDKDIDDDKHRSKGKVSPVQRKPLKHRDYEVDLTSRLGKTQVVTQVAPLNQQAGYYCNVCECVVKDSANFLDHMNGKKHQRALGMSMRVERATLKQVQERFDNLKKRKTDFPEQDYANRILKLQEEEEERKRQRKEKKKEKKKEKAAEEDVVEDSEIAALMGFGGFGTTKKL